MYIRGTFAAERYRYDTTVNSALLPFQAHFRVCINEKQRRPFEINSPIYSLEIPFLEAGNSGFF
jgi:hypothetical protein